MRSPSVFAWTFESSTRWLAAFSAAATISCARSRASLSIESRCFCASAKDERPRSASARPSAISFWRSSIFTRTMGHTHFTETMMKMKKATAWANNVTLRFIERPRPGGGALLGDGGEQRVRKREEHRQAHADDERGIDEAEEQEHLGLQ